MNIRALSISSCLLLLFAHTFSVQAAEVRVLAGAAFAPALAELGPAFERGSGHTLKIQYGITGPLQKMLDAGESFDVAILPSGLLKHASSIGRIASGTSVGVARVGMGVAVRAGAPKPDIRSPDALRRTLLSAKSLAYPPEGAIGIHLAKVFAQFGIADELKGKTRAQKNVNDVPKVVDAGEAELGFAPSTVLLPAPGVDFVGPLPAALQDYIDYVAGVGANSGQAQAAKALLEHLTSPAAVASLKAKGFEAAAR
jgi:molybdate transport system substrate-binding protein